jgi:hypothetical protein
MRRRRNPIGAMRRRVMRRRNPAMLGGNYMSAIREALMDGFGAVAIDYAYNMIAKNVPGVGTFLQPSATSVGTADAVKAVLTVVLGNALNGVTRGFSRKAAKASLTVAGRTRPSTEGTRLPTPLPKPAMRRLRTRPSGRLRRQAAEAGSFAQAGPASCPAMAAVRAAALADSMAAWVFWPSTP